MHCGRHDPSDRQCDSARKNRRGDVAFLEDLFSYLESCRTRRNREDRKKHHDPESGEEERVEEWDVGQITNVNMSEASGVGLVVGRQPSKLIYTGSNPVPRSKISHPENQTGPKACTYFAFFCFC